MTRGLGVLFVALITAIMVIVAASARTEALAFLTVDHRDMDPLIDAVLAGATGDFRTQYADERARLVRQAKGSKDVSNTETGDEPQTRYFRLRLDLVREGGRWLTSNVQFVR